MNSLEKLLKESSEFLHDVAEISSQWVRDVNEERSKEIVMYHPLNSGHMLRPLLAYISASTSEENIPIDSRRKLVNFAASVELMHNASLIHDDLLDEEENRRGKACVHRVYGFKNALLVGNIYYIKAIELSNNTLDKEQTVDLLTTAIAMCEGEILQAKYDNQQMTEEVYDKVVRYKTASLTALACRQAAVIMKEDEKTVEAFGQLGEELGVMYQLRDDRKDKDVHICNQYDYSGNISLCNDRIVSLLQELSKIRKVSQFEEIVAYLIK